MVRFSFYKSGAASFDKVSTKILRKNVVIEESIEVEVGFDDPPRRTHSDPYGYTTETFSGEQDTVDADNEKKQVRITATADTDTWVSHSSSDIPSDFGHSQSGTDEWSSVQSDAFNRFFEDGVPSIATACNGSEEEEDVDVMVDTIAKCHFDIAWDLEVQGNNVVCVDEEHVNNTNPREEELISEKDSTEPEVKDQALDFIVGEKESTKDVREECINEDSKIELNNGDDIAEEECVVEIDNNEESNGGDDDLDGIATGKTEAATDKLVVEDSRDCVIALDTNEESNDCDKTVGAGKTVATSDNLTTMMHERILAINNIRGLIERESETSKYCFISV